MFIGGENSIGGMNSQDSELLLNIARRAEQERSEAEARGECNERCNFGSTCFDPEGFNILDGEMGGSFRDSSFSITNFYRQERIQYLCRISGNDSSISRDFVGILTDQRGVAVGRVSERDVTFFRPNESWQGILLGTESNSLGHQVDGVNMFLSPNEFRLAQIWTRGPAGSDRLSVDIRTNLEDDRGRALFDFSSTDRGRNLVRDMIGPRYLPSAFRCRVRSPEHGEWLGTSVFDDFQLYDPRSAWRCHVLVTGVQNQFESTFREEAPQTNWDLIGYGAKWVGGGIAAAWVTGALIFGILTARGVPVINFLSRVLSSPRWYVRLARLFVNISTLGALNDSTTVRQHSGASVEDMLIRQGSPSSATPGQEPTHMPRAWAEEEWNFLTGEDTAAPADAPETPRGGSAMAEDVVEGAGGRSNSARAGGPFNRYQFEMSRRGVELGTEMPTIRRGSSSGGYPSAVRVTTPETSSSPVPRAQRVGLTTPEVPAGSVALDGGLEVVGAGTRVEAAALSRTTLIARGGLTVMGILELPSIIVELFIIADMAMGDDWYDISARENRCGMLRDDKFTAGSGMVCTPPPSDLGDRLEPAQFPEGWERAWEAGSRRAVRVPGARIRR